MRWDGRTALTTFCSRAACASERAKSTSAHHGGGGGKVCATPAGQSWVSITSAGPASMTASAWARVISSSGHQSAPSYRTARSTDTAPPRASHVRSCHRHRSPRRRCTIRSATRTPRPDGTRAPSLVSHGIQSWFPSTNHRAASPAWSTAETMDRYQRPCSPGQMPKSPNWRIRFGPGNG